MRELTIRELSAIEIEAVAGGVSQDTAIAGNLAIVGIGVGIMVAGATAPIWFPIAMMGASIGLTASFLWGC